MFKETIDSLDTMGEVAQKFLKAFPNDRIFAFYGKMGAGKTTFIKSLCEEMKVEDYVTSPSFSLVNEYESHGFGEIFHFDFYRIKNIEEAFDFGYEDYFFSGSYCFIEWPELIEQLLPADTVYVKIEEMDDGKRSVQARKE